MARYTTGTISMASGAVAGTYVGVIGLKAANTAGHRGRLTGLSIFGGAGEAAADEQMAFRLLRSDNSTDGTNTAIVPTPLDPDSVASIMTGAVIYTGLPTTLASVYLFEGTFNTRGWFDKAWQQGKGPVWGKNQTLLLQVTPGTNNARKISAFLEWEEGF